MGPAYGKMVPLLGVEMGKFFNLAKESINDPPSTWMSQEVRINGDRINGISPTYKWGINWGYNPLILTFY